MVQFVFAVDFENRKIDEFLTVPELERVYLHSIANALKDHFIKCFENDSLKEVLDIDLIDKSNGTEIVCRLNLVSTDEYISLQKQKKKVLDYDEFRNGI